MAKSESASQKLQAEIERLKSDNEKLEDKALALETKVASKDRYNFKFFESARQSSPIFREDVWLLSFFKLLFLGASLSYFLHQ